MSTTRSLKAGDLERWLCEVTGYDAAELAGSLAPVLRAARLAVVPRDVLGGQAHGAGPAEVAQCIERCADASNAATWPYLA